MLGSIWKRKGVIGFGESWSAPAQDAAEVHFLKGENLIGGCVQMSFTSFFLK